MDNAVWTFEELSRDCDGHYCMKDGKEYPARCRYEENMTGHPLGDICVKADVRASRPPRRAVQRIPVAGRERQGQAGPDT